LPSFPPYSNRHYASLYPHGWVSFKEGVYGSPCVAVLLLNEQRKLVRHDLRKQPSSSNLFITWMSPMNAKDEWELAVKINNLSLAGDLPPEILGQIFLIFKSTCRDRDQSHRYWRAPCECTLHDILCIPIMHVCRRWREVALDIPDLWNRIRICAHTQRLEISQLLSERSKDHPLLIEIHIAEQTYFSAMEVLSPSHILRLKRLRLVGVGGDKHTKGILELLQKTPAPLLEDLVIKPGGRSSHLPILFAGQTPRLRKLTLDKGWCAVQWEDPIFRSGGLEHLHIELIPTWKVVVDPSWARFHQILRSSQKTLKTIQLNGCLPSVPLPINDANLLTPLDLPALTEIKLFGQLKIITTVFDCLVRIPRSARVFLQARGESPREERISDASIERLVSALSKSRGSQPDRTGLVSHSAKSRWQIQAPFITWNLVEFQETSLTSDGPSLR